MSNDHPLLLELNSLRDALDRYQHTSHISSLHIQKARLEASDASAHAKLLEAENDILKQEIAFLRANPEPSHTPRQIAELNLVLRRVSDKLTLTESILLRRTTELTQAISEKTAMQLEIKAAVAEVAKMRATEDERRSRERVLQKRCKAAEEEARMADTVVMEYADLVRSLEGKLPKVHRASSGTEDESKVSLSKLHESWDTISPNVTTPAHNEDMECFLLARSNMLIHSLTENRFSLQRLLLEFNSETSDLHAEISRLHTELSTAQTHLDTERDSSRLGRAKLAEALVELDRYKTDDETAGRIVSRYMRFSQSSVDMLQAALTTLKSRHAATLATASSSAENIVQALTVERKRSAQLRVILGDLAEDVARETFGRRREVALRLRGIAREERMVEALAAWLRDAEESRGRVVTVTTSSAAEPSFVLGSLSSLTGTLDRMIENARAMLVSLSLEEFPAIKSQEATFSAGLLLAKHTCNTLLLELQKETEKRLIQARTNAEDLFVSPGTPSEQFILNYDDDTCDMTGSGSNLLTSETAHPPPPGSAQCSVSFSIQPQETVQSTRTNAHVPDSEQQEVGNTARLDIGRDTTRTSLSRLSSEYPARVSTAERTSPQPQSLRDEISHVAHRYEDSQRSFHDCHVALIQLKSMVESDTSSRPGRSVMQNVIRRLDDFCEDARVELEIQIADEERVAQRFEVMFRVPGTSTTGEEEARHELQSFINGTVPSVIKAQESFATRLVDLQHDIAQVKRAFHAAEADLEPSQTPQIWSSWTPAFLSASPSTPSSLAPTFGSVITTPRMDRVPSLVSTTESTPTARDSYAYLGLRIPMPSQILRSSSPIQPPSLLNSMSSSRMYLLGLRGSSSGMSSGIFSRREAIPEAKSSQQGANDHTQSQCDIE